jgi:putative ABC transport system ATP-binding protein
MPETVTTQRTPDVDRTQRAPRIETIEVTKRYFDGETRRVVIDRVSVVFRARELVALRGPSGSGKTTLLGLLGGMIAPTAGDVRIDGESIVHLRDAHRTEFRRRRIGFVFQELALVPDMTLLENVLLPLVPTGGPTKKDRERIGELLARFGLAERANVRAARLSGGERQRGAIVRALVRDPPILLLDEPTAHLDATRARELVELLGYLRDEGKTIVCATHDGRLADDPRIDRVVTLADGRLVAPRDGTLSGP